MWKAWNHIISEEQYMYRISIPSQTLEEQSCSSQKSQNIFTLQVVLFLYLSTKFYPKVWWAWKSGREGLIITQGVCGVASWDNMIQQYFSQNHSVLCHWYLQFCWTWGEVSLNHTCHKKDSGEMGIPGYWVLDYQTFTVSGLCEEYLFTFLKYLDKRLSA